MLFNIQDRWAPECFKDEKQLKREKAERLSKQWRNSQLTPAYQIALEYIEAIAACGDYLKIYDFPDRATGEILSQYGMLE